MHGGIANSCRVKLKFIDSEKIEETDIGNHLDSVGDAAYSEASAAPRGGLRGMILAVGCLGENKIPLLGICLGMQMIVVEIGPGGMYAGLPMPILIPEFDPETSYPVIDLLPDQRNVTDESASMRLGAWPCVIEEPSFAFSAYGQGNLRTPSSPLRIQQRFQEDVDGPGNAHYRGITGRLPG